MRKAFKVLGYLLLGIIVLVSIVLAYIKAALPNVGPAPDLKIVSTPEKIERGRLPGQCSYSLYGLSLYPRLDKICRAAYRWHH